MNNLWVKPLKIIGLSLLLAPQLLWESDFGPSTLKPDNDHIKLLKPDHFWPLAKTISGFRWRGGHMSPLSLPSSSKADSYSNNGISSIWALQPEPIYGFETLEEENKNMLSDFDKNQRIRRKLGVNSKRKKWV